jgi:hypothetical protein
MRPLMVEPVKAPIFAVSILRALPAGVSQDSVEQRWVTSRVESARVARDTSVRLLRQ